MKYTCSVCDYSSASQSNVLRHQRRIQECSDGKVVTTSTPPQFKCKFKGCDSIFSHVSGRSRHEKSCKYSGKRTPQEGGADVAEMQKRIKELQECNNKLSKEVQILKNDVKSNSSEVKEVPTESGYIYLLRERESLRLNESVFKIGKTVQRTDRRVKRIEKYKKGSELVGVWRVKDPSKTLGVESEIKSLFGVNFKRHGDGHEYFIGDDNLMVEIICRVVLRENGRDFESEVPQEAF